MTVNVTLMLCMVTVFTSMLNSLPKTSSVKMIDVWVVFNLMVPFFEIILQTLLYKLGGEVDGRGEDTEKERQKRKMSRKYGKPCPIISIVEKPGQLQVKSESTDNRDQAKNKQNDEGTNSDVAEGEGEMERQKRKLARKASGRYLLVNTIKYVLPGVYTLFCFIFFFIGYFLAESEQIV